MAAAEKLASVLPVSPELIADGQVLRDYFDRVYAELYAELHEEWRDGR